MEPSDLRKIIGEEVNQLVDRMTEGKGQDLADKYVAKLRSEFRKLNDDELDEFRETIAKALDLKESVNEGPGQKHYTKDGKEWTGPTHKMPDGTLMTQDPHNDDSEKLFHKSDLEEALGSWTSTLDDLISFGFGNLSVKFKGRDLGKVKDFKKLGSTVGPSITLKTFNYLLKKGGLKHNHNRNRAELGSKSSKYTKGSVELTEGKVNEGLTVKSWHEETRPNKIIVKTSNGKTLEITPKSNYREKSYQAWLQGLDQYKTNPKAASQIDKALTQMANESVLMEYSDQELLKQLMKARAIAAGNKQPGLVSGLQKHISKLQKKMKKAKTNEASRGKIHKAVKKGSYPVTIVVISNGMAIKQELVKTPEAVPAAFNELQKQYPNANLSIEDNTGKRLFSESVNEAEFKHISKDEHKIKLAIKDVEKKSRLKANRDKAPEYEQEALNKIMLSKVLGREKLSSKYKAAWEKLKKEYSLKESKTMKKNNPLNEVSTISKKRAGAELKQKIKGKRSDGLGKYTATIYGMSGGKRVELKSLNDLNKYSEFEIDESVNEAKKEPIVALLKQGGWATVGMDEKKLVKLSDAFDDIGDEQADRIASPLNMAIELKQDGYGKSAVQHMNKFNKACQKELKLMKKQGLAESVKISKSKVIETISKMSSNPDEVLEGLWDNIRKKKARGESPAKPGDDNYPDSKAWDQATEESVDEGLWDNIRKKKARGGKTAKPGDKDYPDDKAWDDAQESVNEADFPDVSNKFKKALDSLPDKGFTRKNIEKLIQATKEKRPDAAMAYAKAAFGWIGGGKWLKEGKITEIRKGDYIGTGKEIGKVNKVSGSGANQVAYVKFDSRPKSFIPILARNLTKTGKKHKGKDLYQEGVNEAKKVTIGQQFNADGITWEVTKVGATQSRAEARTKSVYGKQKTYDNKTISKFSEGKVNEAVKPIKLSGNLKKDLDNVTHMATKMVKYAKDNFNTYIPTGEKLSQLTIAGYKEKDVLEYNIRHLAKAINTDLKKKYMKDFMGESVTEAKFDKKKLMKAMKKDDGMITVDRGRQFIIYNPKNGNDDNTNMWKDKVIFAVDQDGEEHEIKYSDIVSYNEGKVNEASSLFKKFDDLMNLRMKSMDVEQTIMDREKELKQLYMDMEQEAEPEGGPKASAYGKRIESLTKILNKDKAILSYILRKIDKLDQY